MEKLIGFLTAYLVLSFLPNQSVAQKNQPNIIIIYIDDQRWDALGASGNEVIQTPNMDSLVESGMYFPNSFVTLSICTPSRAALLTGKYGSSSDVMSQNLNTVNPDIKTVAQYFKKEGYNTSVFGKWHISNSPQSMGFEHEYYFKGLAPFWDVPFIKNGVEVKTIGFIEDVIGEGAIEYLREISNSDKPFFMWFNTFSPHMDKDFSWPSKGRTLSKYPIESMPLPTNWPADFTDKPPYIEHNRPHQRALEYGYSRAYPLQDHIRGYYAATTDMDAALGNLISAISELGLFENTFILLMGDNGWFMGEHGLTSKVLAYEESIRVPLIAIGPGINPGRSDELILNIDLMPTVLDLANIEVPSNLDGKSFKNLLGFEKNKNSIWREFVFYEAPIPVHGTKPHYAIRTKEWKLIQTFDENEPDKLIFEELYDIKNDPDEMHNLVMDSTKEPILESLRKTIENKIYWSNENRFNR
ncbi:sulfatase-like hydrolase/transferase [Algoriphagus sp.]|uniref:sulfatase-like hydrolase/transferase n=1 Tax=Algoriphagus sp. TaxID=1872435 RepID=UPI0027216599|nr:sulfatase-like hydrolase/transferase [Algoriphagus sp.]MDO8966297.1 sulfatase-like hydrolase/transferase [Algoriphagus sp.]MDP3198276.1 sulfatase-like hydrolase/transferase [Algoriphagus sp.]